MKVAVVGAGWAGLSAAFRLHEAGHAVTVFEAARTVGGRARRVHSPRLGMPLDNGQHILLGACTHTLDLLQRLGVDADTVLHRQTLALHRADGGFLLRAPALPAPWHMAAAVIAARGVPVGEKLQLARAAARLRHPRWTPDARLTAAQWLSRSGQSHSLVRKFWEPLCLAALNTPLAEASALLLAAVLRDSLAGPASHSDVLIPRIDLSSLWPERLPAGIAVRIGHAVRTLAAEADRIMVDGLAFDAAVLAANIASTTRLLRGLPGSAEADVLLTRLGAFSHRPIATLTLLLDSPWKLPHAMLMLDDAPQCLHYGQWLFNHGVFVPGRPALLSVVVSDARELARQPKQRVALAIAEQVRRQTARWAPMPAIKGCELIIEKRATFAALPGLDRPGNATPWPRLWLAGDWTDTGYPALLEGAVRSGHAAAQAVSRY